jgi:hypothetical protein
MTLDSARHDDDDDLAYLSGEMFQSPITNLTSHNLRVRTKNTCKGKKNMWSLAFWVFPLISITVWLGELTVVQM